MRLYPECRPYGPANVVTGANWPDMWMDIWISDPAQKLPAWLQLTWSEPVTWNTVQLAFDTDQNRRATLFRFPDCVTDYSLEARSAVGWK